MNKSRYLSTGTVLEEKSGLVSKINIDDIMVQTMLCGDNTGSLHVGNQKKEKRNTRQVHCRKSTPISTYAKHPAVYYKRSSAASGVPQQRGSTPC